MLPTSVTPPVSEKGTVRLKASIYSEGDALIYTIYNRFDIFLIYTIYNTFDTFLSFMKVSSSVGPKAQPTN